MLIQITTDTQTTVTFAAGDEIQLAEGVKINAPVVGIFGDEFAMGATMTIAGTVQGDTSAIASWTGGHTVTITSMGSLVGGTTGIQLDWNNNIVKNYGSITTAPGFGGFGILTPSSNNQILNVGTITGSNGIGVGSADLDPSTASNNTVVNSGTINVATSAVVLRGDGAILNNSGTLQGEVAVQLNGTPSGKITIKNTGIIDGDIAIAGSEGADWITNTGTILGFVYLNGGNDIYDSRNGGTLISGYLDLGTGDDIAYGGGAGDWYYGGEGNDTLEGEAGNDWLFGEGGTTLRYSLSQMERRWISTSSRIR